MRNITEYDLAYICYYSEILETSAIAAGFPPTFSAAFLKTLIQELKKENQFDYYKNMYVDLLNE
ncbi:hypothetical protein COD86_25485 [Bacillus cereus]|nr:hypothetical protein COD14_20920 [Bacillus cereus]PGV90596.1 hypothetical protein COD86_25485 [Bacillus cereus]